MRPRNSRVFLKYFKLPVEERTLLDRVQLFAELFFILAVILTLTDSWRYLPTWLIGPLTYLVAAALILYLLAGARWLVMAFLNTREKSKAIRNALTTILKGVLYVIIPCLIVSLVLVYYFIIRR